MSAKRLDDLRSVDPVLTTLAQMHKNDLFLSEKLFPTVKVKKTKGKIPVFGKEGFIARDTSRAIRSDSNRIPASDFSLLTYETQEQDLEMAIDYLETSQSNNYDKYEQIITKQLWDSLALNREIEICNYLQDTNNYNIGNITEISEDKALNDASSDLNPIELIAETKEKVRLLSGANPNTLILNQKTLNYIRSSQFLKYMSTSFPNAPRLSLGELAEQLNIENLIINTAVYTENNRDYKNLWGNNMLLTFSNNGANQVNSETPKLGYIMQLDGMPEVDTYYENGGKIKVIRCTDNFCWKVTMPEAGHLITNIIV